MMYYNINIIKFVQKLDLRQSRGMMTIFCGFCKSAGMRTFRLLCCSDGKVDDEDDDDNDDDDDDDDDDGSCKVDATRGNGGK